MQAIQQWIERGEPYEEGVKLLQQVCPGSAILTMCLAGKNSLSIQRLGKALREAQRTAPAQPILPGAKQPPTASPKSDKYIHPGNDLPPILRDMLEGVSPMYKEARHLHALLCEEKAKGERKRLALRILELMRPVRSCWNTIDKWRATGELPQPKPVDPGLLAPGKGLFDLLQRLHNLQSYKSKRSKELRTLKKPELMQRKAELLAGYDQEAAQIQDRLNVIDKAVRDGIV